MYKSAFNFWTLTLYSALLPNSLIKWNSFLVESIGFSVYTIMSSANNDNFTSSFPIGMPFVSFSCVVAVARISNTMLNTNGESRYPWLLPDLGQNDYSFCPLSMMFAVGFSYMACTMLRNDPSIPTLWGVFIFNDYCTLSNAFPSSIDTIMRFLSLLLFM